MIDKVLTAIFGSKHERDVKRMLPIVAQINALEPEISKLSDDGLRAKTAEFRERLRPVVEALDTVKKEVPRDENAVAAAKQDLQDALDDLLPEAFAVCREGGKRELKMRHFDVQLMGGVVLHRGKIAEMKTGEGKTLVATLPVYLNALTGRGVHVVTVNDYLARRDSEWMGRLYKFLGLTVGVIRNEHGDRERQVAYRCDVTYGTNNEFGFDYLRDNMKFDLESMVQRDPIYAIVDEVDSILIDEARTPLIISGPSEESVDKYYSVDRIVPRFVAEKDFQVDEKQHTAVLTEEGVSHAEKLLNVDNLYDPANMDTLHCVQQALRAHTLYKLEVVVIPPNRAMIRKDLGDLVYRTEREKYAAIVDEIKEKQKNGQPALVGTISVEKSELLASMLKRQGVPHVVLNAKYHEREAEIVAQAGHKGAVTIATNMAGRGTDILLGGNPEFLAAQKTREITEPVERRKIEEEIQEQWNRDHQEVLDLGGLHILGTERHESRRIDNQLRGRSGRQGDPGSSRFYLSLEDDLMRIFGSDRISGLMQRLGMEEGVPIEAGMVTKAIERAQKQVEAQNSSVRKHLLEYDDVMNKQRENVYALRRQILDGQIRLENEEGQEEVLGTREYLTMLAEDIFDSIVETYAARQADFEQWDLDALRREATRLFAVEPASLQFDDRTSDEIRDLLWERIRSSYEEKEKLVGREVLQRVERDVMLQIVHA